ncbi:MAG TPA: hypothetical protein VL244_00145 [Alphaproteobacteria bacterium]|nr:hypothetical protein [Alphaproteobacteria bacterium]
MVDNLMRRNRAKGAWVLGGLLGLSLAFAGPLAAQDANAPAGSPAGVTPVTASDIPASGTPAAAAPAATAGETATAAPARPHIGPSAKPTDIPSGDTIPKPIVAPIPPPAPTLAEIPTVQIPPEVEQAAIDENSAGDAKVREFLTADNADAQGITDRARALVRDLFNNPAAQDKFLDISQHVAELAGNIVKEVAGGQIQNVAVSKEYIPGPNDKGVRFGSADTALPSGFELITPQDPRIKGTDMRVIALANGNPMTNSGISGVRSVQFDVPSGDYRVILMTANSGQPDTDSAPFGGTVVVNSVAQQVALSDPSKWTGSGTLSTPPAAQPAEKLPGAAPGTDALPGTNNQGGVTTHQSGGSGGGNGVLVVNTHVGDNRLSVEFTPPSDHPDLKTFIVGIIAESTIHPSGLQGVFNPLDVQNAIMGDATSLFNPQAGGNGPNTTGAILDPQGTTTPPSYQNGVPPASPS